MNISILFGLIISILFGMIAVTSETCRPDQYTCSDGNCVEGHMRCDGIPQCEDSSDEKDCQCCEGMFQCRDGNCVEGSMVCDGIPQCEDCSDEFECPREPQSYQSSDFQCESRGFLECIDKRLRCDGYPDCSDSSDEKDCHSNLCKPNEFQCPSGQCVMKILRCDGENDCDDGFDESICASPIITLPPVAEIEVELGGTFTIICEAISVPTPLIVWRLNWGNIPTGNRVTTVSKGGRGVLTITDARYSDAGAYTCEAINNRGSIFAIQDALVKF